MVCCAWYAQVVWCVCGMCLVCARSLCVEWAWAWRACVEYNSVWNAHAWCEHAPAWNAHAWSTRVACVRGVQVRGAGCGVRAWSIERAEFAMVRFLKSPYSLRICNKASLIITYHSARDGAAPAAEAVKGDVATRSLTRLL